MEERPAAVGVADVVVFMLDGRAGSRRGDRDAFALMRETGSPADRRRSTKSNMPSQEAAAAEVLRARASSPCSTSRRRTDAASTSLLDAIVARLPAAVVAAPDAPPDLQARADRPPQRRQILATQSPRRLRARDRRRHPGTTRDPVDVRLTANGREPIADRHRRNPPPDEGRGRTRASLGRPRDRNDSPRRSRRCS